MLVIDKRQKCFEILNTSTPNEKDVVDISAPQIGFYWIRKLQSCDKYRQEVYTFISKKFLNKVIKGSSPFALKQIVTEAQNRLMEHTIAVLFAKAHFIPSKECFSKNIFDAVKKNSIKK